MITVEQVGTVSTVGLVEASSTVEQTGAVLEVERGEQPELEVTQPEVP